MVAVPHEVHVADAVQRDRRDGVASALGRSQAKPAFPYPTGRRAELTVEVSWAVNGSDDALDRDELKPDVALTNRAESVHHLVEGQDEADIIGFTPEALRQAHHDLASAGPLEVVLGVGVRESGASGHGVTYLRAG